MTGPICPKCGKPLGEKIVGTIVRRTPDSVIVRVDNSCHEFELVISSLEDAALRPPQGFCVGDAIQLSGMQEEEPS